MLADLSTSTENTVYRKTSWPTPDWAKDRWDDIKRNYSIEEHYRFMGFKDGEIDFCNQSYQQLCKRAANGWDVNVVSKLFQIIFRGSKL